VIVRLDLRDCFLLQGQLICTVYAVVDSPCRRTDGRSVHGRSVVFVDFKLGSDFADRVLSAADG
jgi:hypothetical protein